MKKDRQISVRIDSQFADQLDLWAEAEDITVGDLARKLLRIAAGLYEQAGSLHVLRAETSIPEPKKGRGAR